MKIAVIGGGPGGLYFSILTKKAMPHWQIDIYERNKPDDSFGFGVVFSDETLGEFLKRDMQSYELIRSKFAYWDDIIIARDGEEVSIAGNGFCGCSRKTLLQLLQQRCIEEGVNLHFEQNIENLSQFSDADIILATDGIGSAIRTEFATEFGTKIVLKKNRFVWLGSTKPLDAFTYFFRTTLHGTIVAHSYQYQEGMSTWIFECSDETWQKHGFEIIEIKPLIFDAPYISMRSEIHQKNNFTMLKGAINGLISNCSAMVTNEYSTLLFIVKKINYNSMGKK